MVHGVAYVEEPVVEVDVAQSEAAYLADAQPPTGRLSRMHRAGSIRGGNGTSRSILSLVSGVWLRRALGLRRVMGATGKAVGRIY